MVDLQLFNPEVTDSPFVANPAVRLDSAADFVNFWHGAFGSPALSTFIPAVEKQWIRVPGLSATKIRRHSPNPTATAAGHLDATRQGIQSTKKQPVVPTTAVSQPDDDSAPLSREHRMYFDVNDVLSGRTHSDALSQ